MEIPIELYHRLVQDDLKLIKPDRDVQKQGKEMVQLRPELKQMFETGVMCAQFMIKLQEHGIFREIDPKILRDLKNNASAASKQFNWNTISKELTKVGHELDGQMKTQIVGGDHEQIITVLLKLFYMELEHGVDQNNVAGGMISDNHSIEKPHGGGQDRSMMDERGQSHNETSPSKLSIMKEVKPEQPINIMNLKPNKPLNKTQTTLEFVIISLCQALQITPSQAAGLLTDHNYYLMHACVKGIKGDYLPILKWYQLLYDTCKHLIDLAVESLPVTDDDEDKRSLSESQILDEDTQPLFVLLSALKCGFFSDYCEVSGQAFRLFSKISQDLNSYGYQKVFAKWYLQKPELENGRLGGGLEATLFILSKHSQVVENVALLLISAFKGSFQLLIPEIEENHLQGNTPQLYILINDLLPFLHKHHKEEVVEKLFIQSNLIEDLLTNSMTNKFSDNTIKSASLSLLAEIWILEPSLISENSKPFTDGNSVLDTCLKVFKNTCKFSSRSLKLSTLGLMFKLLDQFAKSRDNQAPVIYKLLTFAMVENIHDDDIREFMLRSFTNVFKDHKTIPVSILVEPFLRIMQLSEKRFSMNCLDYQFFRTLAQHPKLTSATLALQIMDQFAKITLNDPVWCSSAKLPLLTLAERFKNDPQVQSFLLKFCTLATNSVITLRKLVPSQPPGSSQNTVHKPQQQFLNVQGHAKPPGITQLRLRQADRNHLGITQVLGDTPVTDPKTQQERDIARRIKVSTIVLVVERILQMQAPRVEGDQSFNDQMREVVLEANRQYFQNHQDYSKALLQLLEFWHSFDSMNVLEGYIRFKNDEERFNDEEIETILRDDVSHIHEEKGRVIIDDNTSSVRGEIFDYEKRDIDSRNGVNQQSRRIYDQDDYFRILPSDDQTHHSEISSQALRNINHSQLSAENDQKLKSLNKAGQQMSHSGSRQLVPFQNNQLQIVTPTSQNHQLALLSQKPPHQKKLNIMAQRQIDAIKNKRDEKVVKQQIEEEKKKMQREKSIMRAKQEVNRRGIQLGIAKGSPSEGQLVIYEGPQDAESGQVSPKRHSLPGSIAQPAEKNESLKLIDLDHEEEDRDRDGVNILLTKYSKVFKFLFNKYAMSRAQHMKVENFEYFGDKSINLAEICKLLKDHDLFALATQTSLMQYVTASATTRDNISPLQKLNKDQVSTLMRLLNLKHFKRQDLSALSFTHFMTMIPQLAYITCNHSMPYLSLPDMVKQLLSHFEKATKLKGQSTILYEDPDITTIGDMDMLRELNRRIKENPDCIIPEGYYKVQEKEQQFKYQLPSGVVREPLQIAIETLDSIVNLALGFHILEALVSYESRYKVKPRIKQGGNSNKSTDASSHQQPNSGLSFMKPIERKQFNRDLSGLRLPNTGQNPELSKVPSTSTNLAQGTPLQQENKSRVILEPIRPKLSANLKVDLLALQKTNPSLDKLLVQETAETLEELLQAVEQNYPGPHLPPPGTVHNNLPKKEEIKNRAQEDKEAKLEVDHQVQKMKEELRKKRHQQLKDEIERQKTEKLKQEEEIKAKREEEEKEQQKHKRIERTIIRQKVESKRQAVEEAKNKRLEEKEAKAKEDEEKKNMDRVERTKNQKDFFKKQKEQLEQEFQKRRAEMEEVERAKKETEEIKKQQAEKVKSRMVGYMKDKKDQQRNEQQEWSEIHQFYSDQEVQHIFHKYEKSFGQFFKHYAVMDKKDMSVHQMQRISLPEFSKFGFQNKIIPKIISNEDMVLIFRALVRERTSTMNQKEMDEIGLGVNSLGLEDFKKALIRIAILGQANLNQGDNLENILPVLHSQPESNKIVPTTVRAPKNVRVRGRSQINSRGSQRIQQNLAKTDSQAQLDENNDLNEEPIDDENNAQHEITPVPLQSNKPISLIRKTKEQKIIEELAKVKEREEKLMKVKIDDKKFNKDFDVSRIRPETVEAIIKYLGIKENDDKRNAKMGLDPNALINSRLEKSTRIQLHDKEEVDLNHYDGEMSGIGGDDQQASEAGQYNQQHNHHGQIEAVDVDEMQEFDDQNIVGPDGQKETWKMIE